MVLEHDRPRLARVAAQAGAGVVLGDLDVVVNLDAVVKYRHPRVGGLLAVLVFGRNKLDAANDTEERMAA